MTTIINVDNCNEKIKRFKDANAKIWIFDNKFGRLILRLWKFDIILNQVTEEIFISILGCEHINGPFAWKNVDLIIEKAKNEKTDEIVYNVIDKNAGFKIVASGGVGILNEI